MIFDLIIGNELIFVCYYISSVNNKLTIESKIIHTVCTLTLRLLLKEGKILYANNEANKVPNNLFELTITSALTYLLYYCSLK